MRWIVVDGGDIMYIHEGKRKYMRKNDKCDKWCFF